MKFERDYFVQTFAKEKSNYEDYRLKKFSNLAEDLVRQLNIHKNTKIFDFGCATGGLVYELRKMGFRNLKGTDVSYWAIQYGRDNYQLTDILDFHNLNLFAQKHQEQE